jgi:hypothetical protein
MIEPRDIEEGQFFYHPPTSGFSEVYFLVLKIKNGVELYAAQWIHYPVNFSRPLPFVREHALWFASGTLASIFQSEHLIRIT